MTALGELCEWRKGRSAAAHVGAGPYPLITTAAASKKSASYDFDGDAVIVPLVSATGHGNAAIARLHHAEGKFALATILAAGFPRDCHVCARYIWHYLTYAKDRLLVPLMQGTANVSLSIEKIQSVKIPLPPLDEQCRIVARLDEVSARLKARAEAAERQEAELAAMLQQAFARITAGSPRTRMADIAPLVRREVTIEPETLYTEIGIRSFFRGMFPRRTMAGAEFTWQSLYRIEAGDVVFSNLMAWERGIALAGAADAGCVGNHRMLTCSADRARLLPGFLFFYFTTRQGFSQVEAASPGSIARNKTLSPQGLAAIEVPLPSLDAQQWLEALRLKADAIRSLYAAAADDAAALMPAMLHQTFSPAAC